MTEERLLFHLKENPFLLAPMAGITDSSFRVFMRELGAGIVISELVSANGLQFNSEKTKALMQYDERERPVGLQIFGEDEFVMTNAAKYVEGMGADFVDINLGCPVKKVVKKGAGSALLKDPVRLGKIFRHIKKNISIPLTIKIRTGWDHTQKNADEVAQVAFDEGITWVAIHGRTRSQAYSGQADWDYISEIKAKAPLPIIGNGDITSAAIALNRLKESGCDGVMIGRGCLKNPWIFREARLLWKDPSAAPVEKDYSYVFSRLKEECERVHSEKMVMIQLRKIAAWYSAGFPGSAAFRQRIFGTKSVDETCQLIGEFYSGIQVRIKKDTSHEPFLMGGHG